MLVNSLIRSQRILFLLYCRGKNKLSPFHQHCKNGKPFGVLKWRLTKRKMYLCSFQLTADLSILHTALKYKCHSKFNFPAYNPTKMWSLSKCMRVVSTVQSIYLSMRKRCGQRQASSSAQFCLFREVNWVNARFAHVNTTHLSRVRIEVKQSFSNVFSFIINC